ncbi:hypothetical protein IWW50_004558, partial [Coemansia erecta]
TQVADVQITETIHSVAFATNTVVSDYTYNLQPMYTSVAPAAQNMYVATVTQAAEVSYVTVPVTVTITEQANGSASAGSSYSYSSGRIETSGAAAVGKVLQENMASMQATPTA